MKIAETPRITLRHFTQDDLNALTAILADPFVMRFSLSGPKTLKQTQSLLENVLASYENQGRGLYAVVHKDDQKLIGYCGFLEQEIDGQREIEISYRLASAYWGKGLATEAAKAIRDYAFSQLGLTRLISIIEPENIRSIRVADKIGMRHEKDSRIRNLPVRIYAIHKSDVS
ncbi:putative acetyltransferase [Kalymmatonema gypsitolerans NIES-4073]|nr:putative acetyltransferase [Scytonema sp. NIES-4073]